MFLQDIPALQAGFGATPLGFRIQGQPQVAASHQLPFPVYQHPRLHVQDPCAGLVSNQPRTCRDRVPLLNPAPPPRLVMAVTEVESDCFLATLQAQVFFCLWSIQRSITTKPHRVDGTQPFTVDRILTVLYGALGTTNLSLSIRGPVGAKPSVVLGAKTEAVMDLVAVLNLAGQENNASHWSLTQMASPMAVCRFSSFGSETPSHSVSSLEL